MLGRKSLEEKLREGNGQAATAKVLDRKDGADIALGIDHNLSTGVPKSMDHEGDIQKHTYTLRIEPDDEPPFEANRDPRKPPAWPRRAGDRRHRGGKKRSC